MGVPTSLSLSLSHTHTHTHTHVLSLGMRRPATWKRRARGMKTGIRTQLQVSPLADGGSGFSCPSNTPPQHCMQAMGDHLEIVNNWLLFSPSVVPDSVTPWTAARQAPLSFAVSQSLLKFMFIELAMLPDYLILHRPLLPPSILPSIKVFSNELAPHIRWPKYWCFSMSPSNEYSGLISFGLTGLISLQSTGLSRVFSNTTIRKHQFFCTQPPLWSNSHIRT